MWHAKPWTSAASRWNASVLLERRGKLARIAVAPLAARTPHGADSLIITRSPLRISLGGGGTDLPSYYAEHSGFVIAAAIDKYVYITLHEPFAQQLIVKYSKMEVVDSVDELQHPIVRESLKLLDAGIPHLEITSLSDIPAGTGLGSSGSFTTALLRALHTLKKSSVGRQELAEQACHVEMDL